MKLTDKEQKEIQHIIKKAEMKTSGEIVPAIYHHSSNYSLVHLKYALLMGLLGPTIFLYILKLNHYSFDLTILLVISTSMFLGYLMGFIPLLKKFMLNPHDVDQAVHAKALEIFWKNNLSLTKNRTGILIFISLFEKKVVVLADAGINIKVPENFWNDVVKVITASIKNENLVVGLEKAIMMCGEKLSTHFPYKQDDVNELENRILTDTEIDPSKIN